MSAPPDLDPDLAREELPEKPSRWYLTGFIAPPLTHPLARDPEGEEAAERADDDLLAHETLEDAGSAGSSSDDAEAADQPAAPRNFLPSSIGLTVLLRPEVRQVEVRITWGDYRIEPKPHDALLLPEVEAPEGEKPNPPENPSWARVPREVRLLLDVTEDRRGVVVPESAAPQRPGGGPRTSRSPAPLQLSDTGRVGRDGPNRDGLPR